VVQGQAQRHVAAAVVPGDGETLMSQVVHETHEVLRHGPLGLLGVVGAHRHRAGGAVAAHVRAHHREPVVHQERGDPVPRGPGARMTVHQQYRRPLTPVPHTKTDLAHLDPLVRETLEHDRDIPRRACARTSYPASCLRTISVIQTGANGDVHPGGVG
jgi:hypothetical protein